MKIFVNTCILRQILTTDKYADPTTESCMLVQRKLLYDILVEAYYIQSILNTKSKGS
jgi:hypothetical protein